MTGDDRPAVATGRSDIPELASSGLIAPWLGVASNPSGHVRVMTPQEAGASAIAHSDDPVVLILDQPPAGPARVLPWSTVETVVFRNEHSGREFSVHAYDNFDPSELGITHDPSLFEGEPTGFASAAEAPGNRQSIDRILGAAVVSHAVVIPASDNQAATERDRMTNLLVDSPPGEEMVTELVSALEPLLTGRNEDQSLLADLLTRITMLDPSEPLGGRKFVNELIQEQPESGEGITTGLEAVIDLLSGKRELSPFRADKGLRTVKALALFLLRSEPRDTVKWSGTMEDDPLSVVVAASLAGVRTGWTRMPWALRGDTTAKARFEAALADSYESDRAWKWSSGLEPLVGAVADSDPPWSYFPPTTAPDRWRAPREPDPAEAEKHEGLPTFNPDQLSFDLDG